MTLIAVAFGIASFVSGILEDVLAVLWFCAVEEKRTVLTTVITVIQTALRFVGIGTFIESWWNGAFYVAGCAVGAIIAIEMRKKFFGHRKKNNASRKLRKTNKKEQLQKSLLK